MPTYEPIATTGEFPDITWAVDSLYLTYQQGSRLVVEWRNPDLKLLKSWTFSLLGNAGAFARVKFHGQVYIGYRLGAEPYTGHVHPIDIERPTNSLGQIHGALPLVFGDNGFAYIAGDSREGYPVNVQSWTGELFKAVRNGQGTGLSRLDGIKSVTLVDEDHAVIPGLFDPAWAGPCVVGATDRDGQKCIVAQLPDGRECELWKGQDSPNPRICTDGRNFYVIVWGAGPGIRLAKITALDFKKPAAVQAFGIKVDKPKALGYFFDRGPRGDFSPKRNCTVTGSGLWNGDYDGDGDQELPGDIELRLASAIDDAGTAFLGVNSFDFKLQSIRDRWARILGVWTHEPDSPAMARDWVAVAHHEMEIANLPRRPIITVLREEKILDSSYAGIGDALAPEVYFTNPEQTFERMLTMARIRIDDVCRALAPSPLYLCIQSFGRIAAGRQWLDNPVMVEALQQAANEALAREQVLGLWWFAYGRLDGVMAHPSWERWHAAQVLLTPIPELIIDPKPPTKPPAKPPVEKPMPQPGQAELEDFMIFLHEVCYMQELQRKGGLFESPNPVGDRITDSRFPKGERVMDSAAFRWVGEYNQRFQNNLTTPGGPHEAAKREIRQIIHDSDEARRKRGEDPQ